MGVFCNFSCLACFICFNRLIVSLFRVMCVCMWMCGCVDVWVCIGKASSTSGKDKGSRKKDVSVGTKKRKIESGGVPKGASVTKPKKPKKSVTSKSKAPVEARVIESKGDKKSKKKVSVKSVKDTKTAVTSGTGSTKSKSKKKSKKAAKTKPK